MRFHRVRVVRRVPHPERGFTQGLIADGGVVWESTGNYGRSELRRYEFGADAVAVRAELPPELFGEGITYCVAFGDNRPAAAAVRNSCRQGALALAIAGLAFLALRVVAVENRPRRLPVHLARAPEHIPAGRPGR